MNKLLVFNVLCAVVLVTCDNPEFERLRKRPPGPSKVDSIRKYMLSRFDELWQDLSESNDINQDTMQDLELLRSFEKLNENLTDVQSSIDRTSFYYMSGVWSYVQTEAEANNINSYYETFLRFQKEHSDSEGMRKPQLAWTDLAETYLQNTDMGVIKSLEKLHRYTASDPRGSDTVFRNALKEIDSATCNLKQSPHQLLYNLYNAVTLADLKGYTMLQFSYMLLKLYNKGNFTVEAELAKSKFEERTSQKIEAARTAMGEADRSVYNCDPKSYVEGENYVKLTRFLQGYIENEVNLNPYGTCRENCAYYYYTQYNGCFKEQFCNKQPSCKGRVVECRYYDSDMNICKSSDPERRYDWVEYENGRILGTKGTCENRNKFKVDSWWRYLFWHCSYCFCFCDEEDKTSDRYFNLREVTSNLDKNKIMTGVRIVKHNQIIHIQIQEGELGPRGVINTTTVTWKPVDNYTVFDLDTENGVDYHTLHWNDRGIDIDDTFGPAENVLTGVRFRKIGNHLNLEIRTTPFNFTTGKLYDEGYSYWMGNDNTEASLDQPRKKIKLEHPDIPIRKGPHVVDSKHDQFIVFQPTSEDTDVSQNTVPYLDAQPLISSSPLSGLGLIHRGKQGSGGFIAPKLISFDFTPHLIAEFPVTSSN